MAGFNNTSEFERDLAAIINKHSMEQSSNTPDFILARFLARVLDAYGESVGANHEWHNGAPGV